MPSEIRYIIFSPSETLAAVQEYRRQKGAPLVDGAVTTAELLTKPEIAYRLAVRPDNGAAAEQQYLIDAFELGLALVLFCFNEGIPLPAASVKSLQVQGGSIALRVAKDSPETQLVPYPPWPRFAVQPQQRRRTRPA
jgi:hypothetical protein